MLLRHEISYDAPVADVPAMLSDPALRRASADAMGVMADLVAKRMDKEQLAGVAWLGGHR